MQALPLICQKINQEKEYLNKQNKKQSLLKFLRSQTLLPMGLRIHPRPPCQNHHHLLKQEEQMCTQSALIVKTVLLRLQKNQTYLKIILKTKKIQISWSAMKICPKRILKQAMLTCQKTQFQHLSYRKKLKSMKNLLKTQKIHKQKLKADQQQIILKQKLEIANRNVFQQIPPLHPAKHQLQAPRNQKPEQLALPYHLQK